MGENKRLRKQIDSLTKQVDEHHLKIADELRKPQPNKAYIEGWKKEIQEWQTQIDKKEERLARKRR